MLFMYEMKLKCGRMVVFRCFTNIVINSFRHKWHMTIPNNEVFIQWTTSHVPCVLCDVWLSIGNFIRFLPNLSNFLWYYSYQSIAVDVCHSYNTTSLHHSIQSNAIQWSMAQHWIVNMNRLLPDMLVNTYDRTITTPIECVLTFSLWFALRINTESSWRTIHSNELNEGKCCTDRKRMTFDGPSARWCGCGCVCGSVPNSMQISQAANFCFHGIIK